MSEPEVDDRTRAELLDLAAQIEKLPVGGFASDADRGFYLLEFWKLAHRFVAEIALLPDDKLRSIVVNLDPEPEDAAAAFRLHARFGGVAVAVRDYFRRLEAKPRITAPYVSEELIAELSNSELPTLDLSKTRGMCEELNACYERDNFIACALLIRAIMSRVPPVFGQQTFEQVAANAPRSVKKALTAMEETARAISDLHNHAVMRAREPLPTRCQIEPFRANMEVLLQEIIAKATRKAS